MNPKIEAYRKYSKKKMSRGIKPLSFKDWRKRHWGDGDTRMKYADFEYPEDINDMIFNLLTKPEDKPVI